MPKVDVTQKIPDVYGNDLKVRTPNSPEGFAATIRSVSVTALDNVDQNVSGEERNKIAKLISQIVDQDQVSLTVEEISRIKAAVGRMFPPTVVGPVWDILDPPDLESN